MWQVAQARNSIACATSRPYTHCCDEGVKSLAMPPLEKIHCLAKLYSLEQQLGKQCVDTLGGHNWLDRRTTSTAVLYLVAATLHCCLIQFQVSSQMA